MITSVGCLLNVSKRSNCQDFLPYPKKRPPPNILPTQTIQEYKNNYIKLVFRNVAKICS